MRPVGPGFESLWAHLQYKQNILIVIKAKKQKQPNMGLLFVGAILLIVSAYLFITQTDFTAQIFGGGIVAIVAIFLFIN